MSLLQSTLEGGIPSKGNDEEKLRQLCEIEINALHATFVTWFRGAQALNELQNDLQQRMAAEFSHVAPNGHMVKGRDVLLQYLTDKYGCYQDRIFSIDVYNVELLWFTKNLCLVSYEEWQSWEDASDPSENGTVTGSTSGKQQFGRLSSCLLDRTKDGTFRWIHVHETWMENEEPIIKPPTKSTTVTDDETVMTGPVPPNEIKNMSISSQRAIPSLRSNHSWNPAIRPSQDDDGDDDEEEESLYNLSNVVQPSQPTTASPPIGETVTQVTEQVAAISSATTTNCIDDTSMDDEGNDDDEDDEDNTEDDDDEDDDEDEEEERDNIGPPAPKLTADEQKFLEASHGILFFEEDEDAIPNANAPVTPKKLASNGITLDDLMESDQFHGGNDVDFMQQNQLQKLQSADQINNSSQAMLSLHSAADASHKRHVSPNLGQYAIPLKWDDTLVGVSIAGFDIGTSQGPIANADWYTSNGKSLETSSQPSKSLALAKKTQQRKIVLPEMVYPIAHVALEGHGIWLSWDATDCLQMWASCHSHIAINTTTDIECNGVSVMKSKDAKLWEQRKQQQQQKIDDSDAVAVFHYDWTYSSPFSVKMEGGVWIELEESGMRMDLLTDQNAPILFFDEIVLYEDDLHDNGHVQYSIKLRIMPTCSYVLARLWVRVDHVLVRTKETRVLVDFFGIQPQVYRDITWRECSWDELASHGLPSSINAWSCENGETAEWHSLIQRLPEVKLPDDIIPHAVLEYGTSVSDKLQI
jgi:hypothetical protein